VTAMGANENKIKDLADFKRAIAKSDYNKIKAFHDTQPTLYADFKAIMKREEDKRRGIIEF
jgi:histone deacetylase complex regulatory component SIN3